MSFSGLIVQIVISSPSDLPNEHREIIARTMRRWNTLHGRIYGIHFSPTDSEEGGAPAFGEYAQNVVNEQIIDDSDMVLAVFTDRLGTATPGHPSGTAEEINRALAQGKEVAVLQNNCQRSPARGADSAEQQVKLNEYIASIRPKAFLASYDSIGRLAEIVEQILSRLASKYRRDANSALLEVAASTSASADVDDSPEASYGIWPRVEVTESVKTDSKGRIRTSKNWYLVLESTLWYPAHDVSFTYLDDKGDPMPEFDLFGDRHDSISILAPAGTARYPIAQSFGSPQSAQCRVEWTDENGELKSTTATVRAV
ncbi:nucleoside 2-deoxyribosyltransferase [Williamsia sp. DF01-3]|uniref:nucleoside 2-deoxyribosyltransferase n=1 Tax=Williamsia sp. DF01-3 TaxID=2934157 RepID=UPI001FF10EEC|nr:nucleoside 2-deoxyribosyltransferase [Williamsia sp. DF01-3]MCK0519316.1 nucleoside 2-deoxyribosyltransferase [Williamsia sp. DF01-3]